MAFLDFVLPLRQIATELRIMRELHELDLAARGIQRVTEKPKKTDTTVGYQGVAEDRPKFKLPGGWFNNEASIGPDDEEETLG